MDDRQILDLYWARAETAISETDKKYGRYCHCIAYNILFNDEDSKECVNDTWLRAWEAIPPHRPDRFAPFLGRITRNLSLDRYKHSHADKRGAGQLPLVLDELKACVPAPGSADRMVEDLALADIFNRFLAALPADARKIFMRRYWYMSSVKEIAADFSITESKVKMSLLRSRNALKQFLHEEGVSL